MFTNGAHCIPATRTTCASSRMPSSRILRSFGGTQHLDRAAHVVRVWGRKLDIPGGMRRLGILRSHSRAPPTVRSGSRGRVRHSGERCERAAALRQLANGLHEWS
ncbi:MAG: hypothetical protein ACI841_002676 [Planctomycetota bacterium]|jgi:hypothetical protein